MKRRTPWPVAILGTVLVVLAAYAIYAVSTAVSHYERTLRLAKAVRENKSAQVRLELAAGADPNSAIHPHPLSLNIVLRLIFRLKRPPEQQETLVRYATQNDDDQILQSLLEAGGSVRDRDENGRTALWYAAMEQRHGKIRLLVEHGADVNDPPLLNMLLAEGIVFEPNPDDITYLLAHGADPNDRMTMAGNTSTPLTTAAFLGTNEVIRDLLRAGANINMRGTLNAPPLTIAAFSGRTEAVVILLKAGADTTLRDQDGKTAEEEAAENGQKQIAQMIHNFRRKRPL